MTIVFRREEVLAGIAGGEVGSWPACINITIMN
jgi:hypothetical protein